MWSRVGVCRKIHGRFDKTARSLYLAFMSRPPASPLYPSRSGAGALLGQQLAARGHTGAILLGITPEGVEIAAHAARALGVPFDVIVASFIRLGSNLAPVGAMAESAPAEMDPDFQPGMSLMDSLQAAIDESRARVRQDLVLYRTLRPVRELKGRHVVIVDAVVAFPWRMLAAARVAEAMGAGRVTMAAPVASQAAADRIGARLYEFVCPAVLVEADPQTRYFGDGGGDAPERLRAIMIAHQAA